MYILQTIESNAYHTHLQFPECTSARMDEAVRIAIYICHSYVSGESFEMEHLKNEANRRLIEAILYVFDPFSNDKVKSQFDSQAPEFLNNRESLKEVFKVPILCLCSLAASVESWNKRLGTDGYFRYISGFIEEIDSLLSANK